MINSTTLILATLVFNVASVLGAPIRIPTAPEVAVRSVVEDAVLPRAIVDVQPEQRSVDEYDARDTASSETVEMRSETSLPEVEEIVRRYPRGILHDFYVKRSPAPSSDSPLTPEPLERRFPRASLYEKYTKRAESEPEALAARSEPETRTFARRELFERHAKRSPTPEPAPVAEEELVARADTPAPAPTASSTPSELGNLGAAIASAIANSSPAVINNINGPAGSTNSWSQSKVEIIITHSGNRKVELAVDNKPAPVPGAETATPTVIPPPEGASPAVPTATPTSTEGSDAKNGAPAATPTATGTAAEEKPVGGEDKPADNSGETTPARRDFVDSKSVPTEPIAKRTVGLSGALWATWSRRSL